MNNDWEPKPQTNEDWSAAQIHPPKVIYTCDLFGQGQITITFTDVGYGVRPVPNRWIRFWTRVFFNSKWNFENEGIEGK